MKTTNSVPRPLWKTLALAAGISLAAGILLYLILDLAFLRFFDWNSEMQLLDMESPLWNFLVWMQSGPAKIALYVWQLVNTLLLWDRMEGHIDLSGKNYGGYWLVQLGALVAASLVYLVVNREGMLITSMLMVLGDGIELAISYVLMLLLKRTNMKKELSMKTDNNKTPRPMWKKIALASVICLAIAVLIDIPGKLAFRAFFNWDVARAMDNNSFPWVFMTWVRNGLSPLFFTMWELLNILLMWEFLKRRTDLKWKGYGLYWLVQLGIILGGAAAHLPKSKALGVLEVLSTAAGTMITLIEVFCIMLLLTRSRKHKEPQVPDEGASA